jgi:hypothetical protein
MGNTSKTSALMLTLIIAISCPILLNAGPANAQSGETPNYADHLSTPSIPQFSLSHYEYSYSEMVTEPGMGITYPVNSNSIELTIKNQPFTPYNYSWTCKNMAQNGSTFLGYDVQVKVHGSENWVDVYSYPTQANSSEYTVLSLPQGPSVTYGPPGYELITPTYPSGILIPSSSQFDFRVRAVEGGQFPAYLILYMNLPLAFISKNSSWSDVQTVTLPANSPSPSPNPAPSIPDVYLLVIVPLLLLVFAIAAIVRHRKTANPTAQQPLSPTP